MMRRALISLLVVLAACTPDAASNAHALQDSTTAARVRAALAPLAPRGTIATVDNHTLVVTRGDLNMEIHLENAERSCASSAAECDDAIAGIVASTKMSLGIGAGSGSGAGSAVAPAPDHPLDKTLIRLTPKPADWLASADERTAEVPAKAADNRIVRTPFAADLQWVYVVDEPNGMRVISQADLRALAMTREEVHALALANLAAQYPKLTLTELAPGMWTLEPGDYLDSARLALTEQWRAEAKLHGGKLVVTTPARSRVFISNAPELRPALQKLTEKAFADEDHPLSTAVLEWTDRGWRAVP